MVQKDDKERIVVLVKPDMKKYLTNMSNEYGMSVSSYINMLLADDRIRRQQVGCVQCSSKVGECCE